MDETVQIPSKLLSQLSSAAERVRKHDFFRVISHYDADGISSAGIICQTLQRAGKEYQVSLFKSLNSREMESISKMDGDCLIISDMGASFVRELEKLPRDVIILDHHTSQDESDHLLHINPHLHGIDGMTAACGASMCMLLALAVDESNWDLAPLALAGMAGDRQHTGTIQGINRYILQGAEERGLTKRSNGSLIPSGDLEEELYLCTDPYIPDVSGAPEGVSRLLQEADIAAGSKFETLELEQRRRLSSLIALRLIQEGVTLDTMMEVSRPRYFLPGWDMDSEGLASLFNACGRMDMEGMGISLALGDEPSMREAKSINRDYRVNIVQSVTQVRDNGLVSMDNIQYFHSPSTGFTGIMCGIAMQFFADPGKPTLGLSRKEETVRVSGRATWKLLEKGVDLSSALREASQKAGGNGGGHRIASGGAFPLANEDLFLQELNAIIGAQLLTSR
ncbi:MAG: DHH family phosphoesterase [Candidatus Methanomethylophilaceae archaeon]|nr:DHH family phosphoesterase [Candidatus Methanomethylophilaceae archaeon]